MVEERNKDSNSAKKRLERTKRKADDVKVALVTPISFNHIVNAGQRELTDEEQRLQSSLLIDDDYFLPKTETDIKYLMQESMSEDLNPQPSSDAIIGHFRTDQNNHVPDHPGDRCGNPIKESSLDGKKAVHSLLSVNNSRRCTLTYQKPLEDKPASTARIVLHKEATSTGTCMNSNVNSKKRRDSPECTVVQQVRLDFF